MMRNFNNSLFGRWLKAKFLLIPLGLRLTNFVFQRMLRINSRCRYPVHFTSQVRQAEELHLEALARKSLCLMSNCNIQAHNGIYIGERTFFASGLTIISANHNPENLVGGDHVQASPVRIGEDCWIGANVTILPGVEIGDNVIIGACSVVTKSFQSDVVIAGNPARIINSRLKPFKVVNALSG